MTTVSDTPTPDTPKVPDITTRPPKVRTRSAASMFDPAIVRRAIGDSFRKLNPRQMARNPVMFVVELGSVLTTVLFFQKLPSATTSDSVFVGLVTAWLWFTVLFANFAEAVAEGRGKAQAETLRKTRADTVAQVRQPDGSIVQKLGGELAVGDECVVPAGELIPGDGDVIEGIALGRRVGDHRRIGAGDPRIGRRSVGGDGRDSGAVRPDHRPHHVEAGRDVPRPDDRTRRRRRTPEDAERDRAQHPAGRA